MKGGQHNLEQEQADWWFEHGWIGEEKLKLTDPAGACFAQTIPQNPYDRKTWNHQFLGARLAVEFAFLPVSVYVAGLGESVERWIFQTDRLQNRVYPYRPPIDPQRSRCVRAVVVISMLGLAALGWLGCSEQKHYKTLAFFFDGVPDPNAPKPVDPNAPQAPSSRPTVAGNKLPRLSVHKPYLEDKCTECHAQGRTQLSAQMDSQMCINCHQKELTKFTAMHAPVVGKACLWCHDPHESPYAMLLRSEGPQLCIQCHERESLTRKVAEHMSPAARCIDCHFSHGGDHPPFLKPKALAATTRATTVPAN